VEKDAYHWFCRALESAGAVAPSPALLTAKNDAIEARIIEQAGRAGAVTISARMAGRGTDIRIDEEAASLGGLYVIGFARNESRHVDQQIRGRSARQGNPGESVFYVSIFTDELTRGIVGEGLRRFLNRLEHPAVRTESAFVTRNLRSVEFLRAKQRFHQRKLTFEFDSFLDRQRRFVYDVRRKVLTGADVVSIVDQIARNVALRAVALHWPEGESRADSLRQCLEPLGVFSRSDVVTLQAQGRERAAAAICDHLLRRLSACRDRLGAPRRFCARRARRQPGNVVPTATQ
jgi:preprotein translocase subunit SecA